MSEPTVTPPKTTWPVLDANERRVLGVLIEKRSEEHTSELQSPCNLVSRLLLEKKNRMPGWSPDRCFIAGDPRGCGGEGRFCVGEAGGGVVRTKGLDQADRSWRYGGDLLRHRHC